MPIEVRNVFYTYLKKTPNASDAIKGISLDIEDNSFIAIVGATGSGKSTFIQHLNGLLIPDSGEISIDEFKITNKKSKNKNIKALRKKVGVVFQFPEYQLFEETVEKDVAFGPKNFGDNNATAIKKAREALNIVGLDESYYQRSPFELSGGEKRRVAIAGILAIDPQILVLDEPTAGLDPVSSKKMIDLISDLHKNGKTIILVTHDMDLVLKYASKVVVFKSGVITYQGDVSNLFNNVDETHDIEVPTLFKVSQELNKNNFDIDTSKIKNIDDLVSILKERLIKHG
jgi:energy-coupling factor transport system ATP-binding protein